MNIKVKFAESDQHFKTNFKETYTISDGGYERGYGEGYAAGQEAGTEITRAIVNRTITTYSDDEITTIGGYGFFGCSKLESAEIPNVTELGQKAFSQCAVLKHIELPNLTTIGGDCFTYCVELEYVDLGQVKSIPSWSISNCKVLKTVVIRKSDTVAKLVSTNAITNTLIASGTGYIYVPDNLVEQYKAATNWSTYAAQIKPLSELEA